jgi:hypothetical protein
MFKGVSWCIPTVSKLYFDSFKPFHYSSLPLLFHPSFSTAFSTYPYILYLHRSYVSWYCWGSIILFSFPSPEFHSVVHIANMFYIYVYKWLCLVLCICSSFGSIFQIWKKTCLYLLEPGLLHLIQCTPTTSIYLQTTWCHFSLWLSKTPLCVYISNFLNPFISCRASGLFP